jgi:hypothetical protein
MLAHLRHQPISASFPLLIPSQRRHASNQVTIRKHIAKVVRKYRVPENQSAVPGEKEDTEAFRIRKVIAGPKPEEYTGEVTIRKFPIGYNPMNPKHVPKEKEYIPGELPVKCKITTILTAHGSVANKVPFPSPPRFLLLAPSFPPSHSNCVLDPRPDILPQLPGPPSPARPGEAV